jgi:hypothetical protein
MVRLIKVLWSHKCITCGRHKPTFTQYCDDCFDRRY